MIGTCPDTGSAPDASPIEAEGEDGPAARAEPLSPREADCLRMAATGLTDVRAARVLGITRSTVRFHIHNACRKLGAANRSAAIYRAAKINCI